MWFDQNVVHLKLLNDSEKTFWVLIWKVNLKYKIAKFVMTSLKDNTRETNLFYNLQSY